MTLPALMTRKSGRFARTHAFGVRGIRVHDEDGVTRADAGLGGTAELVAEPGCQPRPVLARIRGEERQLARPGGRRIAIHRDAGTVRPAVVHLREHRSQMHAEALLDLG